MVAACSKSDVDPAGTQTLAVPLVLAPATHDITLLAPAGVSVLEVTLGSREKLDLGPSAHVTRANDAPALLTNVGGGGVTLRPSSAAGHVTSTSLVSVHPKAHLLGGIDAPAVSLLPGAIVDGPVNTAATVSPPQTASFQVQFPAAETENVTVGPHQARELLPARFGAVSIAPNGTLTLKSGGYYFESFDLLPGSTLALKQDGGPTRVFVRVGTRLGATVSFAPSYRGFAIIQIGTATIDVSAPFRGVLVAPHASVDVRSTTVAHRGVLHARSILFGPKATWNFEPPNPLVGLLFPPSVDLQACADALRPRDDSSGLDRERAFQSDIARYCSMPGTDDCKLDLIGRVNVDYFLAAGKIAGGVWTPAQYLAVVRDRTRKSRAAEDDPVRAAALCADQDADEDWIPYAVDQCPNTPELTATDDAGCPDPTLPEAPSADHVRDVLDRSGFLLNPNCGTAPVLPKLPAGAFYRPAELEKGTYILSGRVMNQPAGCPVWYLFDIEELNATGQLIRQYKVAFSENERTSALVGSALPVPDGIIQFNPRPADAGTRGLLGSVDGTAIVRFRVRAMNGAGVRSGWSEPKTTTNADCLLLGFSCGP